MKLHRASAIDMSLGLLRRVLASQVPDEFSGSMPKLSPSSRRTFIQAPQPRNQIYFSGQTLPANIVHEDDCFGWNCGHVSEQARLQNVRRTGSYTRINVAVRPELSGKMDTVCTGHRQRSSS